MKMYSAPREQDERFLDQVIGTDTLSIGSSRLVLRGSELQKRISMLTWIMQNHTPYCGCMSEV